MKPGKQQFNIYLPPELIRKIKFRALDDQLSLSGLVELALENYLRAKPASTPRRQRSEEEK